METGQVGSLPLMSVQNEVEKEGPLRLLQLCEATLLKKVKKKLKWRGREMVLEKASNRAGKAQASFTEKVTSPFPLRSISQSILVY